MRVSLRSSLHVAGALASCSYAICRTPLLARHRGAHVITVGLIGGASTASGIVRKLLAGVWSDVLGRRLFLFHHPIGTGTALFVGHTTALQNVRVGGADATAERITNPTARAAVRKAQVPLADARLAQRGARGSCNGICR